MKNLLWSVILACGIALAGYFVYCGLDNFATRDRHVTVKGLSEREVMADKVTWSMSVSVSGNVLELLYGQLGPKQDQLLKFLKQNGVTEDEIFISAPSALDRSDWYNWNEKRGTIDQYVVSGNLTIVSGNVQKIMDLHMKQLELLQHGVLLEGSSLNFEYTGLNELKPSMVEEATQNARIVANKFAEDAQCSLGSIRTARQGQFEVESDEVLPHKRHIRVVTTIEYYLK